MCKCEPNFIEKVILKNIPGNLNEFYQVGGQFTFPVRGPSGGIMTYTMAYLVKPEHRLKIGMMFTQSMTEDQILCKITEAINNFNKYAKEFDPEGGDLGLDDMDYLNI